MDTYKHNKTAFSDDMQPMKRSLCFISAVIALGLLGCATKAHEPKMSEFTFDYEGKTYRIRSINPDSHVGYNRLLSVDKGFVVFDAIDSEQDGVIDRVDTGEISAAAAQAIYESGLGKARQTGHIKRKMLREVFRTSDKEYNYVLNTYDLAVGDDYNRLAIIDKLDASRIDVVLDEGADGSLDTVRQGNGRLEDYQAIYDYVLAQGLREGKVIKSDSKLIVVNR